MSNQGQEGGDLDPRPGSTRQLVVRVYPKIALAYFVAATSCLMLIAFLLMIFAFVEVGNSIFTGDHVEAALSAISLLVIGFAVVETAKFIAEEEIMRKRELRSSTESRRSITKFITIIVIAASLEALVMVFQATRDGIEYAIYPAFLFIASMLALVALGTYQWLSSRIDSSSDERMDHGDL